MDRTPAPLAAEDLRDLPPALRPVRDAAARAPTSTRRAGVGASPVLRRRLGVRGPCRRAEPSRRRRRPIRIGTTGVLLTAGPRRRAARLRQHLPPPRPRAAGLRRDDGPGRRPVPVPRLELRARRLAAAGAALRRGAELRPGVDGASPGAPTPSGAAGCSSTSTARRGPVRGSPGRVRHDWRPRGSASACVPGGDPRVRAARPTGRSRSRTTTSATTARSSIPSCAGCRLSDSGDNVADRAGGVGRWRHGAGRRRRDDEPRRSIGRRRAARPRRRPAATGPRTSTCSPTCWSACTPTT